MGNGEISELSISLDINSEIYPVKEGEVYRINITRGEYAQGDYDFYSILDSKKSMFDSYKYVMHGKVFKYSTQDDIISLYISFGGLILKITGTNLQWASNINKIPEIDQYVFLMMRNILDEVENDKSK